MQLVWLASYPRSGVTFLRHVLERVYGLKTFTLYKEGNDVSGVFNEDRLYSPTTTDAGEVHFVKTHYVESACMPYPAIHLVRDPFDTMVSQAHYERDIREDSRPLDAVLHDIVCGETEFGMWGTHLLAWLGRPAIRMSFDALIAAPIPTVIAAVQALQLPLEPNHIADVDGFPALQKRAPLFFRSGKTGNGRSEISPELATSFESLQGWAHQRYKSVFGNKDKANADDTLQRTRADGSAVD